ncbi:Peptidyl-prolyl cis-trans isomerase pin4 [Teratosphaeriaceae sp. CCFEE 6253]|nr:Peptidyl-prolyl cis-trans isomerase pin4 [Teratosphaeriaceae sp. CCFEE 6253]
MNHGNFDMYTYDQAPNRSPASQRQLHRQASRQQVEPQAYLPSGLYADAYGGGDRFQDMRNATIGGYGNGYDMGGASWNANAFGQNNTINGMGGNSMRRPHSKGRSGLPAAWMDQNQPPMPSHPYLGGLTGYPGMRQDTMNSDPDDDLIPTAIVIKNIPFAVKKEQLVSIMTDMGLPLPYAFNYHFDNGVFRGLAFANFTNPDETAIVIETLNHFELNGRKLRVEYKKMLPAAERERIEREKRERRGQLEEQHRPIMPGTLQTQGSVSSLTSRMQAHSPSPVSARNMRPGGGWNAPTAESPQIGLDLDMNDPQVLSFYSKVLVFKEDPAREMISFPPTLKPEERRIVHTLAHYLGLGHTSKGEAHQRSVQVYKEGTRARVSPPMPQIAGLRDEHRRTINRAATTDFSEARAANDYYGGGLRAQASGYLGGYHDMSSSLGPGSNLRNVKSFAELRSYSTSPAVSTASFPAALGNNVARMQDFGRDSTQSNTPTLMTPTSSLAERGENTLISGLGNMNLGSAGFGASPHSLRGISSWDREAPGPIGGHRSFSTNFEDRSQSRSNQQGGPERQPRGPIPERGAGFPRPRQNGHAARNSDEMSQQSSAPEITVEH